VGRDVLVGFTIISGLLALLRLQTWFFPATWTIDSFDKLTALLGGRNYIAVLLQCISTTVFGAFLLYMLAVLIRVLVRRWSYVWLLWIAFGIVFSAVDKENVTVTRFAWGIIVHASYLVALTSSGLLALMAFTFWVLVIMFIPLTADPESWCSGGTQFAAFMLATIAAYSFYTACIKGRGELPKV
jgi:hypothetical protein